jgi:hypothetical protein
VKNNFATLCGSCYQQICRPTPIVPNYSIASGIDFGNPERIGLPTLTLIEELLLAQSRLYVSIVKLIGNKLSERQSAKRGHVITFPQPDGPTKLTELQRMNSEEMEDYPRIKNLSEFISVVFVGTRLQFEALVQSRFSDVRELRVRVEVVYQWLHALKHLNPLYRNVNVVETNAMHDALNLISSDLLKNVTLVDNETDIRIDRILTPEGTTYVPAEEVNHICDSSLDQTLPSSFLTRSIPLTVEKSDSVRTAIRGLLSTFEGQANLTEATELPEQTKGLYFIRKDFYGLIIFPYLPNK